MLLTHVGDIDDEVVGARVVATFGGDFLGVVLTSFVQVLNKFNGLLLREVLLAHDALHALVERADNEHAHGVRVVTEHIGGCTTGDDAGTCRRYFFQAFLFHRENVVRRGGGWQNVHSSFHFLVGEVAMDKFHPP